MSAYELPNSAFLKTPRGVVFAETEDRNSPEGQVVEQALSFGFAEKDEQGRYLIPWRFLHDFVENEDGTLDQGALAVMELPSTVHQLAPSLQETGSLADQFGIRIDDWVAGPDQLVVEAEVNPAAGPFATLDGAFGLLPKQTWLLLEEIRDWNVRPASEKNVAEARRAWALTRRTAIKAGARLSDYLKRTVVIDANTIDLTFESGEGAGIVQVTPVIDGAPVAWLETFDSASRIRDVYRTSLGDVEYEVVLDEDVSSVLEHLKASTSGQRHASGARAASLIQNPYSVLGPRAGTALHEDQVSTAREAWEAGLHEFVFVEDVSGDRPAILILATHGVGEGQTLYRFSGHDQYARFMRDIDLARQAGVITHRLGDRELLIDELGVQRIEAALERFPVLGIDSSSGGDAQPYVAAAQVLDLAEYADRVEKIDQLTPFGVVRVPNAASVDWTGGLVQKEPGVGSGSETSLGSLTVESVDVGNDQVTFDPPLSLDTNEIDQMRDQLESVPPGASIALPGDRGEVPDQVAKAICAAGEALSDSPRRDGHKPRMGLVEATNADRVTYEKARQEDLTVPGSRRALLPESLRDEFTLLPHQLEGLTWLQHLWEKSFDRHCCGAMLADDMGLGKTIQTLSLIASAKESRADLGPSLVVAPVSLLANWQEEADKFFEPGTIEPVVVDGSFRRSWRVARDEVDPELASKGITSVFRKGWDELGDLYLMNYETVRDFQFSACQTDWSIAVFDEAQKIKNPAALVTRAAKVIKADFRIACTGTPVENSLTDLWCLFDTCVQPGLLGAANDFATEYTKVIQGQDPAFRKNKIDELRRQIDPQVKRRLKTEVARDLPEKLRDKSCLDLRMSGAQESRYRSLLEEYAKDPGMGPLALLPRLASLSSDFSLLDEADRIYETAEELAVVNPKFAWLLSQLDLIRDMDEKVLIFVHLKAVQRNLRRHIQARYGIDVEVINGDTSSDPGSMEGRQQKIAEFSASAGFQVMILSPVAAGVGLNIQAANHVIHYMRHWNPAKEDQATDRAYRIGQEKPVTVYTPIVRGNGFRSFDEGLDELLERKRELAKDMLEPSVEVDGGELIESIDLTG